MNKNLTWKIILITVLVFVAAWTLYPPDKTLKPGIDLAGGTSLIYEIDTQGLESAEKKGLAQKMITVLRRRIDPANIQNLIWRPQGNTRFEIQMPLASAETQQKRDVFETALIKLLDKNVSLAKIMISLQKPAQQQAKEFEKFSKDSPDRLDILNNLATTYNEYINLRKQSDDLSAQLKRAEEKISKAELNLHTIKSSVNGWAKLDAEQLADTLKGFLESDKNLGLLTKYVQTYATWAKVAEQLTAPETGKIALYKNAKADINKLNLTADQINYCLEMSPKSAKRVQLIEQLKTGFPDRADLLEEMIVAYDQYRPFRGILDSSKDLKRMLKGAGILEFRILPTLDHPEVDPDEMLRYTEALKTKGPKYASDNKYTWCEVENLEEWKLPNSVLGQFGEKTYILASNKSTETMLHTTDEKGWKLKNATPRQDEMGRRAIGFTLDERAGKMFFQVTGKNLGRPLCILLDGIAISAPNIKARIRTQGIITGSFTQVEVSDMVNKLNAGSLPARLIEQPILEKSIGPSIGADNRDQGIKAGFIGLAAVILCMTVYYTLAGSIADMALLLNLLFVLATMALVRATFTLPGIAGIILTIGMAVDANVLIFERIREEQSKGSSLRIAIRNGYQRAFRTILDANLTTFITAAILYMVASEEIKGFAIVLMLGIVSSMFTALFVTRVVFDFLLNKRIIKDHLVMMQIIRKPNINWMALRPAFFCISLILVSAGLFTFFTRDDTLNNKYDIEFTGGTSVVINLKNDMPIQEVRNRLAKAGNDLNNPALAAANVYSINKSTKVYEINTTETNKTSAIVTLPQTDLQTAESMASAIADKLNNPVVTQTENANSFAITTSQTNKSAVRDILTKTFPGADISKLRVDEVVNNAILTAFADELQIQQNLQPKITSQKKVSEAFVESNPELADFMGGVITKCKFKKTVTAAELKQRFKDLRFKPDMQNLIQYPHVILNSDLNPMEPDEVVQSFVYLSVEPEAGYRQLTADEWTRFTENEKAKIIAAAELETSLPRVMQIDPSVGAEAKTQALIAIVLSLFAIVTYIWIRFGSVRYGLAAIAALVHDVCITLGVVTACTYIAGTPIGEKLLIGDFKINLAVIAAFLTIIGYSLNDTIVVFDRIRENRHKARLVPQTITNSINQTLSRTLMTSFTTFLVVLIMYIFGGPGLRGFTFAIGFGIIIGTYSSIAIAAPILLLGSKNKGDKK
ncbi:MAG: protein translocase subunit SecD [Planctomycetes bacterium]|nr:protein translocase subunit SecD [Planctomycetota bacterium]